MENKNKKPGEKKPEKVIDKEALKRLEEEKRRQLKNNEIVKK